MLEEGSLCKASLKEIEEDLFFLSDQAKALEVDKIVKRYQDLPHPKVLSPISETSDTVEVEVAAETEVEVELEIEVETEIEKTSSFVKLSCYHNHMFGSESFRDYADRSTTSEIYEIKENEKKVFFMN